MDKKVGVIIPIYNVEKYLKECLESVISQSYTNLEILLINDGSSDENSLKIAKEYTLKDERIILIDKENGGASTARNAGIEFFQQEYQAYFEKEEYKLSQFKIKKNNSLNIHAIYKKQDKTLEKGNLLEIPKIDYLIFLDSDDLWQTHCIEQCVKRMPGVDVLWFDHAEIYDGIANRTKPTRMEIFAYKTQSIISPKEYCQRALKVGSRDIAFAWNGMIDFNYLQRIKLKFINKIMNEDIHFGTLLFASANKIYVLPQKLYLCRLRTNSVSNHDKKVSIENIAPYFAELYTAFDQNTHKAKQYFKYAGRVKMALALINFFEKNPENENYEWVKKVFLPFYVKKAMSIKRSSKDPWNLKEKLKELKPYSSLMMPYELWKIWQSIKNKLT